ncbi:MAG: ParB/RepB/Spo0J family partition protein [Candidatus Aminicenantes bacterium]|nr:ParB/RepB/Spo0J family partition protein [Candidatus Aminicenantes bacterium]
MQKTKKTGLPETLGMRHDGHFVELISTRTVGPRIRMIPIDKIDPNPQQARSELGDIDELMASIKEKGILEPIIVRPRHGSYEIIAGERRYIASKRLGLKEMPCIEKNVEDNEAMEIALIENLQRKDLAVFEEADGLQSLAELYGYSHQQIAQKIGKARSTITETINLVKIPKEIRKICKEYGITSRSTLIEIAKQKNVNDMSDLVQYIQERDLRREDTRELSKRIKGSEKKAKKYVYNFKPTGSDYKIRIEFRKKEISKDDIIKILEEVITSLKSS